MDQKDTIKRPLWLKAGAPTIFLAAILQIVAKWIAHNRFPDWRTVAVIFGSWTFAYLVVYGFLYWRAHKTKLSHSNSLG